MWRRIIRRCAALLPLSLCASCVERNTDGPSATQSPEWSALRIAMASAQIEQRGVSNASVLAAMRRVPRHEFVPERIRAFAYDDRPLPIGLEQTISQPYIVAAMTEALELSPEDTVLEIGTGSGYQAAVLAEIVRTVYSIEILPALAEHAKSTLARLHCTNIVLKTGDGYAGWPEHAPFNAIVVTCAPDKIPQPLIDQLAEGGRMVIPVGGSFSQELVRVRKKNGTLVREQLMGVVFVPMTGKAQK